MADAYAPKELHEQRVVFHLHGTNFHSALSQAERFGMEAHVAALTQALAVYAQNTRDFAGAARLFERRAERGKASGNQEREASAYHQLGIIAQEQRDFAAAEQWHQKALPIFEKLGDEHHAASTYGQLGIVAGLQECFEDSGRWLVKCMKAFLSSNDPHGARRNANNFLIFYRNAPPAEQTKLRAVWQEAGLGDFPEQAEGAANT